MDAAKSIRLNHELHCLASNIVLVYLAIAYATKPVWAIQSLRNDKFIVLTMALLNCANVPIASG